jgi:hypothetical protein
MESRGIQIFTIPESAVYEICAKGAGSKDDKATGAIIKGKIQLKKGHELHIAIAGDVTKNLTFLILFP